MSTDASPDPEIARGLRRRQLVRRINGVALGGIVVLSVIGTMLEPAPVIFRLCIACMLIHLVASGYLRFVKCPRCRQSFSHLSLWVTWLKDQTTTNCDTCGISLPRD